MRIYTKGKKVGNFHVSQQLLSIIADPIGCFSSNIIITGKQVIHLSWIWKIKLYDGRVVE